MVFETKKINIETLGEYLSEIRASLNLSAAEAADRTGIKKKFLQDLESGDFSKMPADVYAMGFLKKLAKLYGVAEQSLIDQYKKEATIHNQLQKRAKEERTWKRGLFSRLVITPKLASLAAGLVFVAITIFYIIWQVFSINRAPSLEIFEPQDRQVIKGSSVTVRGKTDPGIIVEVNQQNVFVDQDGNFKTQLGINIGPKELVVTAKNKFDKTVSKTISIVGESELSAQDNQVQLKLEFSADATLTYSIDNAAPQTAVFHSGEVKQLAGKKKVTISVSDAGAVKAFLNNQALGALGRDREQLSNIQFFASAVNGENKSE